MLWEEVVIQEIKFDDDSSMVTGGALNFISTFLVQSSLLLGISTRLIWYRTLLFQD